MEKKDRVEKQEKFRRTNCEGKLRKLSEKRERQRVRESKEARQERERESRILHFEHNSKFLYRVQNVICCASVVLTIVRILFSIQVIIYLDQIVLIQNYLDCEYGDFKNYPIGYWTDINIIYFIYCRSLYSVLSFKISNLMKLKLKKRNKPTVFLKTALLNDDDDNT